MPTAGDYTRPAPRVERATAVTDGSGNATFTWSPPFPAPPVVALSVEAGGGFRSVRLASNSAGASVAHCDVSAGVTLLGLGVLAVGTPASGVTVHAIAVEP